MLTEEFEYDEFPESEEVIESPPPPEEPDHPPPEDSQPPRRASKETIITALCEIAFGRVAAKSRSGVTNKLKALELLGRHKGLFIDKVELSGPGGGPVPVEAAILGLLTVTELEVVEQAALIIDRAKKKQKALGEGKGE